MDNLADISLDLICMLKFPPPDGYDIEDTAAMGNACWQTLAHALEPAERAAIAAAAPRQIEELEMEPTETLPEYLLQKLAALRELASIDTAPDRE